MNMLLLNKYKMEEERIKQLLAEGLAMLENVDSPSIPEHCTKVYCENAYKKLKKAGTIVYSLTPNLSDMICVAQEYVPEQHQHKINHAWSGIGEWCA